MQGGLELRRETLAGHEGSCEGYKLTEGFGNSRQPFTWLSQSEQEVENRDLANLLQECRRDGKTVPFEAWTSDGEEWEMLTKGEVLVLYAECDERKLRVRAILQWATDSGTRADAADAAEGPA